MAKSVIARTYFQHYADQRGWQATSIAVGIGPKAMVWPEVVDLLHQDGIDVSQPQPQGITQQDLDTATRVIALGCDLGRFDLQSASVEWWNGIPLASHDLLGARAVIRAHMEHLVEEVRHFLHQGEG